MNKYTIIVAGGKGKRMQSELPKQFLEIGGHPILFHTIEKFRQVEGIQIILVLPQYEIDYWNNLTERYRFPLGNLKVVAGGKERFDSVYNGLSVINDAEALVAVHDGVRSFVSKGVIENSFAVAEKKGNAVVAVDLKDSIRYSVGTENKALDRSAYKLIQTPQTFRLSVLQEAYKVGYKEFFTDDASVVEHAGHKINLVPGNYENIKITTPEDLLFAQAIINQNK